MSQAINDSILNSNFGGGQGASLDFELSPEEVIDTECVEVQGDSETQARTPHRNRIVFAVAAVLAVLGGAATQTELGRNWLGGGEPSPELAFLDQTTPSVAAESLGSVDARAQVTPSDLNPFVAALPSPAAAIDAADLQAELVASTASMPAVTSEESDSGETVGVDRIQGQAAGQGTGTDTSPPAVPSLQVAAPAVNAAPMSGPADAPASADVVQPPAAALKDVPANVARTIDPAKAPASVSPLAESARTKDATEHEASAKREARAQPLATPAPPKQTVARAPVSRSRQSVRAQPRETAEAPAEKVRSVMMVTAAQIGLRELTSERLVVKVGANDLQFRVADVLPSGERIEQIDPIAMAVITDRSVIRVRP